MNFFIDEIIDVNFNEYFEDPENDALGLELVDLLPCL